MKETIDVVGAVIFNGQGQVLCALRAPTMSSPNVWEFPGGKIEAGEAPEVSLRREILEELGCTIDVAGLVEDTTYEGESIVVRLLTYYATITEGVPVAKEHAALRWLPVEELESLGWAPADIPAVQRLIEAHSVPS